MKTIKFVLFTLLISTVLFSCSSDEFPINNNQNGINSTMEAKSNRKIVVLKNNADLDQFEAFAKGKGASINKQLKIIHAVSITLPDNASDKALEAITKNNNVERIDDDIIYYLPKPTKPGGGGGTTTPAAEVVDWGVDRIDADNVWVNNTGENVKVGILDTGIDLDHPDLKNNIAGGANFVSNAKSEDDDNGHGSHVAGVVAAIDNEEGIVGVAPKAKLYAVKVLDRRGSGYLSDIISGIEWCVTNNIQVINMSLGSSYDVQAFHDAITAAYNAGIVIVCAAGNNSGGSVDYPGKYTETIAVSAVTSSNEIAYFSSIGDEVDFAAPGANIYSTYKSASYKALNGTSMASPHVAGVVALVLYKYPSATPAQVKTHLINTAENLNLSKSKQGNGLIDAEKASNTSM